tara:strand:+ start:1239 stop:1511 length:273 start_codon:yes stop_codon:yes gene_type:complete
MPKYEYICDDCGFKIEKVMSTKSFIKNKSFSPKCSNCNSENTRRLFSSFSSKVERSKGEIVAKAKADAKKIVKKIKSGDLRTIRNIYGEN